MFTINKLEEKIKAIDLRRKGHSYREIIEKIPVAKSTLSLWLRDVGISTPQKQRITAKRIEAGKRGALAQRNKRISITNEIKQKSSKEIKKLRKRDLWLMGVALYWAEGAKEKEHSRPTGVKFCNSDPFMIRLFLKWLIEICNVPANHIKYELYIHEKSLNNLDAVKKYWAERLQIKPFDFHAVYFKKHKINSRRKNAGKGYYGLVNICVRKSTNLNRKIAGWVDGIIENYWGIV